MHATFNHTRQIKGIYGVNISYIYNKLGSVCINVKLYVIVDEYSLQDCFLVFHWTTLPCIMITYTASSSSIYKHSPYRASPRR